jgi:NAD(P)-dependent dehydrogenase (short-subunit alcohol dehydrogenase family)
MGTNHLGHFLLTLLLVPALRRGGAEGAAQAAGPRGARIVSVSSNMHHFGYSFSPADPHTEAAGYLPEIAYGRSKLAQVRAGLGPHQNSRRHRWGLCPTAARAACYPPC